MVLCSGAVTLTLGSEGVVGTDATSLFAGGLVFFTVDLEGGLVAELLLEVDFGVLGSGLLQSKYEQTPAYNRFKIESAFH
jgi:hypothetical protein